MSALEEKITAVPSGKLTTTDGDGAFPTHPTKWIVVSPMYRMLLDGTPSRGEWKNDLSIIQKLSC